MGDPQSRGPVELREEQREPHGEWQAAPSGKHTGPPDRVRGQGGPHGQQQQTDEEHDGLRRREADGLDQPEQTRIALLDGALSDGSQAERYRMTIASSRSSAGEAGLRLEGCPGEPERVDVTRRLELRARERAVDGLAEDGPRRPGLGVDEPVGP